MFVSEALICSYIGNRYSLCCFTGPQQIWEWSNSGVFFYIWKKKNVEEKKEADANTYTSVPLINAIKPYKIVYCFMWNKLEYNNVFWGILGQ